MNKEVLEGLDQVATNILESAAFLFPEQIEDEDIETLDLKDMDGVKLTFSGAEEGCVYLWATIGFKAILAANMLGVDESDPKAEAKSADAFKEILNIIVGSWVTEVWGDDTIHQLGLPQLLSSKSFNNNIIELEKYVLIDVEGYTLILQAEISE